MAGMQALTAMLMIKTIGAKGAGRVVLKEDSEYLVKGMTD